METAYWVGLGTISATVLGILISVKHFNEKQQKIRVENFVQEFRDQKKEENGGREDISALSLAGLNSLKNDKEYKLAFEKIKGLILHHPLLKWKDEIEEIGYKKFFNWVSNRGVPFTSDTIDKLILDFKND